MQAVFHPGYVAIHRDAAMALQRRPTLIFRGDGGENERRPEQDPATPLVDRRGVRGMRWPAIFDPRQAPEESMEVDKLEGSGAARPTPTARRRRRHDALALYAMGVESDPAKAQARAGGLWGERDRGSLRAVA